MSKFEELLFEYADKFEDNFPIFMLMAMDENEMIEILEDSIENNKKYVVERIDGAIY